MAKTATKRKAATGLTTQAARLVEESFVFNTTEAVRTGGPGKPRMNFTGLDVIEDVMIEDWRKQGFNAVLIPQGILDPASMAPVAECFSHAQRVFGYWNAYVASHTDDLMLITRAADFDRVRDSGRIGFLIGTHNAGELFRTLDDIDAFHQIGLRHGLLTCFGQNRLGTSADEGEGRDGGLTRYGRAVVERMNKVGLAVDVSHCGAKTRREAFDASSKPVLITHGNAAAVCPSPRNNSDEMLRTMAATGGVIGLMFWRPMVSSAKRVTVEHVLDHFDHVSQLIGPQHVGLGLETPLEGFDSCENVVGASSQVSYLKTVRRMDIEELCDHRRIYTLVEGLLRRGYSDADVAGILGGNFERAFREIFTA